MLKDYRPVQSGSTASTPGYWARNLSGMGRLTAFRRAVMLSGPEIRLIRRHLKPGGRILDAGSGDGAWVELLRTQGFASIGIDYSPDLVALSRRRYPLAEWLQGDIRATGLPEGRLDGIVSWGVIEHEEEGPGAALREFLRVLRPGGRAIVTVPADHPRQRRLIAAQTARFGSGPTAFFQYVMTAPELAGFVAEAGFSVVEAGHLARASAELLAPEFYARNSGSRLAVKALWLASLVRPVRADNVNMVFCVAEKPA